MKLKLKCYFLLTLNIAYGYDLNGVLLIGPVVLNLKEITEKNSI